MGNNYLPIITESTINIFNSYLKLMNVPDIDYCAIGIQHPISGKSISLMSRPEWQHHFIYNNYANSDPIRKSVLHSQRTIIPISEIDHVDNFGKEIMQARKKMGIIDGLILVDREEKYNYMITLATGYNKFDYLEFIQKYSSCIKLIKRDLIEIINADAQEFLPSLILPTLNLYADTK